MCICNLDVYDDYDDISRLDVCVYDDDISRLDVYL